MSESESGVEFSEEEIDLDALYDSHMEGMRAGFRSGEKISGVISVITDAAVFVDVNYKSEGVIDRAECMNREGDLTVEVGDSIEAMVMGMIEGELRLTVRVSADDVDDSAVAEAFANQIPVTGKVTAERKGGFEVMVGDIRGFCPFSQMGFPGTEAAALIGQNIAFRIKEYNEGNLIVSRRELIEAEQEVAREKMREKLVVGEVVTGRVSRIVDFGLFVDLGGVDGLVPMRELAWKRVGEASDVAGEGDQVEVKIVSIDWDRNRISLSIRQATGDPWDGVGDRYHVTKRYHGVVARTMDFGAFVELEPGVEGLVHISRLGDGKRLSHAREVLAEGEELDVYVDGIDIERRRISLRLDNPQLGRTMDVEGDQITVGGEMIGTVQDIRHFGVFIQLTPSHTGLLHVSEIDLPEVGNRVRMMQRQFQKGQEVTVLVKSVHQNKVSLALPGRPDKDDEDDYSHLISKGEDTGLGSLGSVFSGLDL